MADSDASRPALYLASRSPRRRDLLQQIGVTFTPVVVEVDETRHCSESPEAFVQRVSVEKARAGQSVVRNDLPVLGADTAVVLGERILGKPADRREALAMLAALSDTTHRVVTGVALAQGDREAVRVSDTLVTFRQLSVRECISYWNSGEPLDKAGAYAIQGLAAVFVARIEGSYSGVVGLPLYETCELLRDFGIYVLQR